MPTSRKRRRKLPALDKSDPFELYTEKIAAQFHLGPKGRSLVKETFELITGHPGGLGGFLGGFKAAGCGAKVASWVEAADPVPLSEEEVEQALGSEVIGRIANTSGASQGFAKMVLGKIIPAITDLLLESGFSAEPVPPAPQAEEMAPPEQAQIPPAIAAKRSATLLPGRWLIPGAAALVAALGAGGYFFGSSRWVGHRAAADSAPVVANVAPATTPPNERSPSQAQTAGDLAANEPAPPAQALPQRPPPAAAAPDAPAANGGAAQTAAASTSATAEPDAGAAANEPAPAAQALPQNQPPAAAAPDAPAANGGAAQTAAASTSATAEPDAGMAANEPAPAAQALPQNQPPAAVAPSAPAANDGAAQTAAASPAAASQTSGNEQAGVSTEASHKLPAIYFASNSVKVSPASKAALEEAAGLIRNLPRGSVVWINGYPDRPGNPARNIRLSRKRANAVRQALMDEGISPTTLIARGYPSSPPAIDNNESTGDRSSMAAKGKPGVEFRIVQQ